MTTAPSFRVEMRAFDQLPREVRAVLVTLDFNWSAEQTLMLVKRGYSVQAIRGMLLQSERTRAGRDCWRDASEEGGREMTTTHELKVYANKHHRAYRYGELLLHLWFMCESAMQMDLDIALSRPDVAFVDLIDCEKFTTTRLYPRT